MALPLQRETELTDKNPSLTEPPSKPSDLKIVPIQPYDAKTSSYMADLAAEEVEIVLKQAGETISAAAEPLHEFGERLVRSYDGLVQEAALAIKSQVKRLRRHAEDDPVRFLTIVAAGAFVVGFALRFMTRSRHA